MDPKNPESREETGRGRPVAVRNRTAQATLADAVLDLVELVVMNLRGDDAIARAEEYRDKWKPLLERVVRRGR